MNKIIGHGMTGTCSSRDIINAYKTLAGEPEKKRPNKG
jgi:hypothetical protein